MSIGKIDHCHVKYKVSLLLFLLYSSQAFSDCTDEPKTTKEAIECVQSENELLRTRLVKLESQKIDGVPKGAVIAFNLDSCPSGGWVEYKLAYGRFIRGIDKSNKNIDADGLRVPGSTQEQLVQSHSHSLSRYASNAPNRVGNGGSDRFNAPKTAVAENHITNKYGGAETRPKNVALLYCIKQ